MINVDTLHEYIEVHGTCWHWTKHIDYHGYGKVWFNGKPGRLAHRIVYQLLIGPIPDELPLDHLCRVTHCVNPDQFGTSDLPGKHPTVATQDAGVLLQRASPIGAERL